MSASSTDQLVREALSRLEASITQRLGLQPRLSAVRNLNESKVVASIGKAQVGGLCAVGAKARTCMGSGLLLDLLHPLALALTRPGIQGVPVAANQFLAAQSSNAELQAKFRELQAKGCAASGWRGGG